MLSLLLFLAQPDYTTFDLEGWTIHQDKRLLHTEMASALPLLQKQLKQIVRVVPAEAVKELKKVPLWFSPEYPGVRPAAEYHPGAGWLRDNKRNPAMAKGVEFTNVRIFEKESRRMPNFALHELAHAYHDRVLAKGFENPDVKAAFEKARDAKLYDKVERRDADGKPTTEKAYALNNQMEFFAEQSEAFFSKNDFFPFDRVQLGIHDPETVKMLKNAWGVPEIERPPETMNLKPFYGKYFDAEGYPVLSSPKVNDYALKEAGYLINMMLAKRPDVKRALVEGGSRMVVIGYNEFTTDVPEYSRMTPKDFWDARARGLGGSATDPVVSCAEENVLSFPGDPYAAESIVIHEFSHSIHIRGVNKVDATFDKRLRAAYDWAMKAGLWKGKYASTNHAEYFAEGVQSWFDNNRENDSSHNHVNTRTELLEYDPGLAALCREVFGDTELKYTKAPTRLSGHMTGYDASKAPTFTWPDRLKPAREQIKKDAEKRDKGGGS
jgi:Mlc titration factor MtfA (ptsG expression regulator)